MQESMSLKYEPASEALHTSVKWLFTTANFCEGVVDSVNTQEWIVTSRCRAKMVSIDSRLESNNDEEEIETLPGGVSPKFGWVRDQICTTQDPTVNCVMQVDF